MSAASARSEPKDDVPSLATDKSYEAARARILNTMDPDAGGGLKCRVSKGDLQILLIEADRAQDSDLKLAVLRGRMVRAVAVLDLAV